jgi:hypothetical protein
MSDKSQKSRKTTTSKSKTPKSSSSSPKSLSDVLKIIEDSAATRKGSAFDALSLLSQGSAKIRHQHYYPVLRELWRNLPIQTKAIKYVVEMANIANVPQNIADLLAVRNKAPVTKTKKHVKIHELQNFHGWPSVHFEVMPDDIRTVEMVFTSEHVMCVLFLDCETKTEENSKSKKETFLKCISSLTLTFSPYVDLLKRERAFKNIYHSTLDVSCEATQKKGSTKINFTDIKVRTHVPEDYKKMLNENNALLFDSWIPLLGTFKMIKKQRVSYPTEDVRYLVQFNGVSQDISRGMDAPLHSFALPENTKATAEKQFMNLRKAYPQKFADLYEELKLDSNKEAPRH